MLRAFTLIVAVLLASIALGYGSVREHDGRTARAAGAAAMTHAAGEAPSSHRLAGIVREPHAKSVWALLRGHARADDELSRASALWDDDADDGDDDVDDTCLLGAGSSSEDAPGLDLDDCASSPLAAIPEAPARETAPHPAVFHRAGLGPALGHASLHERPPRAARG